MPPLRCSSLNSRTVCRKPSAGIRPRRNFSRSGIRKKTSNTGLLTRRKSAAFGYNARIRNTIECLIEPFGKEALRYASPFSTSHLHHVVAKLVGAYHARNFLGWMLSVGVHGDHASPMAFSMPAQSAAW